MKSPESLKHAVCTNTPKRPVDTHIKQIQMNQKEKIVRKKKATLTICEENNQTSFQEDNFCPAHFVNANTTQTHDDTTFHRHKLQ